MTSRRSLLLGGAALVLAGCPSSTTTNTTVQGIVDWLKTNCQFATTAEMVVAVIVTVVAGFNPAAGAGAAVAAAVAKQVEDAICNALKAQLAQVQAQGGGEIARTGPLKAGSSITIKVNGVDVTGTWLGDQK